MNKLLLVLLFPALLQAGGFMVPFTSSSSSSSGGGVTTMAAIGSSANANGATISSTTLNLEPASASFGGVVTTGTQTFAGNKTFTGTTDFDGKVIATPSASLTGGYANEMTLGTQSFSSGYYLSGKYVRDGGLQTGLYADLTSPTTSSDGYYIGLIGSITGSGITTSTGSYVKGVRGSVTVNNPANTRGAGTGSGNFGIEGEARTGNLSVGVSGVSRGAGQTGIGGLFMSRTVAASGKSYGVISGATLQSAAQAVGVYSRIDTLDNDAPDGTDCAQSAGLCISNGNTTSDIAAFYNDTTKVISISDASLLTFANGSSLANSSDVLTLTNGPAGTAGNPGVYLRMNIAGTTYVFPGWRSPTQP